MKLNIKFLLSIGSLLIIALLISNNISIRQSTVLNKKSALEKINEGAEKYGVEITKEIDKSFYILSTIRDTFVGLKKSGLADRGLLNDILKTSLESNPNFLGIYTVWEPNALDGKDRDFINKPGHDSTGRFIPYWSNLSRNEDGSSYTLNDYDDPVKGAFYLDIKESRNAKIRQPFTLPFDDLKGKLFTTVRVPIIGEENKFLGILAIDLFLDPLDELVQNINFMQGASVFLIDDRGYFVTNPNPEEKGKTLYDLENNDDKNLKLKFENLVSKISKGEKIEESLLSKNEKKKTTKFYRIFIPINISNTGTYWSLMINIPEKEIFKESRKLSKQLISISIITLIIILSLVYLLTKLITKPIIKITNTLKDLSEGEGDLTVRINLKSSDELGDMANYFNIFLNKLSLVIFQIKETLAEVNVTSNVSNQVLNLVINGDKSIYWKNADSELNQGILQLKDNIKETMLNVSNQTSAIEEIVAGLEEIAATSSNMTKDLNITHDTSQNALKSANESMTTITTMNSKMEDISKSVIVANETANNLLNLSKNIENISLGITSLAEQTNLLALNASIEAARAGDAGRGFAVVAVEIKKLADQTNEETHKINQIIDSITKEIQSVKKANETVDVNVEKGKNLNSDINKKIINIKEITEQNNTNVLQLISIVRELIIANNEISLAVTHINENAVEVEEKASLNYKSSEKISLVLNKELKAIETSSEKVKELNNEVNFFKTE